MYGIVKAMALDRTNTAPGLYSVLRGNEIVFEGLSNVTPLFSTSFLPVKMTTTKKVDPLFLSDLSEQGSAFQMNSAQLIQTPFLK